MRKYYIYFLHLVFLFTFLIFFFLGQKVYEIDYSRKRKFEKGIGSLPVDTVNEKDLRPTDQREEASKGIPHIHFDKNGGENDVNKPGNNDNKIDEPEGGGINAFIKDGNRRNRGDNRNERLKLPPFVDESPDDGLGEHGKKVMLNLNPEEAAEEKRLFDLNDFNQYLSDRISVHRRLDDTRKQGCKDLTYPQNLPMVSVIICFHNEAWSVLLRSVHSIIDRSPPELLKEIILVDDFSTMAHLQGPLDQYMEDLQKVQIVRASKREGLIRGRLLGYDVATGPVLVFLDSHIECFPGWLEPLVARISEDPKAVVFPSIPPISRHNFAAFNTDSTTVGSFRWDGLTFTWRGMTKREKRRRTRSTDPIRSPSMPGGLFAIDKEWFTTLGTYDPGLDYWGGENMELSFKSWMCNGSIEMIPCSQVGHIYRTVNPITWHTPGASTRNSMRVAEVWMDEYKETFYDYSFPKSDFGDVSDRKRLRDSLHCHNFKWYLDNVLQADLPPTVLAFGEIRSAFSPYCLDSMGRSSDPQLFPCHGLGYTQRWVITETNNIMQGTRKKLCFDRNRLHLNRCSDTTTFWQLNFETGTIQHTDTGWCLELQIPKTLGLGRCNDAKTQQWILPTGKTRNTSLSKSKNATSNVKVTVYEGRSAKITLETGPDGPVSRVIFALRPS